MFGKLVSLQRNCLERNIAIFAMRELTNVILVIFRRKNWNIFKRKFIFIVFGAKIQMRQSKHRCDVKFHFSRHLFWLWLPWPPEPPKKSGPQESARPPAPTTPTATTTSTPLWVYPEVLWTSLASPPFNTPPALLPLPAPTFPFAPKGLRYPWATPTLPDTPLESTLPLAPTFPTVKNFEVKLDWDSSSLIRSETF